MIDINEISKNQNDDLLQSVLRWLEAECNRCKEDTDCDGEDDECFTNQLIKEGKKDTKND